MRIERIYAAIAVLVVLVLSCPPTSAQGTPKIVQVKPEADYSSGRPWWTGAGPYRPMFVPEVQLTNSARVEQLIRDGKLMLSLEDTIALALENNLDISVQRYGPWIADTGVLRATAGQGTASGGFDPVVTAFYLANNRNTPVSNPLLAGTGAIGLTAFNSHTTQANFSYAQGFSTGTSYLINFDNTRRSSTSPAELFNPSVQSSLTFSFQQPLLNGLGFVSNRRFLRIARNNKRIADLLFQDQVINTVSAVQTMYWDLVFAREDVNVKQRSVELAQRLYNDNKRQVEIGTLAPIEVVRAEAEVARTNQDLIVSQTFLLQQQTLLKNAITKNSMDPAVLAVEVVPTDSIGKPEKLPVIPLQDAVGEAWEKRPDVRQQRIDLENRKIATRATRNGLLPSLTFGGQFGGTGLSGTSRSTTATPAGFAADTTRPLVDASGNVVLVNGQPAFAGRQVFTSTTVTVPGGLSNAFSTAKNFDFPNYAVTLNLNIPIRNRAAQADNAQAQLEERQSETRLRQLQNSIVVQVRNAQIALEQNQARVDAAIKSRELQERTLDAEQKKYQLGASSIFLVIQAQRDLAQAQSTEVRALADLIKARVEFERTLGRTLDTNKISLTEAKTGNVTRGKNIPGRIVAGPVVRAASQQN